MAKNDDPTVRILKGGKPEYPEGTHPVRDPSEVTWGPDRFSYSDLEEAQKPSPSTVAVQVEEPLEEENQKVMREDAKSGAKQALKEQQERAKNE